MSMMMLPQVQMAENLPKEISDGHGTEVSAQYKLQ